MFTVDSTAKRPNDPYPELPTSTVCRGEYVGFEEALERYFRDVMSDEERAPFLENVRQQHIALTATQALHATHFARAAIH